MSTFVDNWLHGGTKPEKTKRDGKTLKTVAGIMAGTVIGIAIAASLSHTEEPLSPACERYQHAMAVYGEEDPRGQAAAVLWNTHDC